MKLSEMRQLLSDGTIQLTKSLGQNFLHDAHQLQRIVKAAELTATDQVLEVGPGLGPLTELLVAQAGKVLAIETDLRLIDVLKKKFSTAPNLTLLHDDALAYIRRASHDWSQWKLVANLPYSIASPLLVDLAESPLGPRCIVVTLQLEVARRLEARADDDDYGLLSLLVQLRYEPRGMFKIPSQCFFPEPGVDSACITLLRRPQPLLSVEQSTTFKRIVKRAFSQRRKMMMKLLKQDWSAESLSSAFSSLGISPQARAEAVELERFIQLASFLHATRHRIA